MSDFVFSHSLQRAIKTLEKYQCDEPCYYEYLVGNGYSIITKRLNQNSKIYWVLIDYAIDKKESFINGYKEISL